MRKLSWLPMAMFSALVSGSVLAAEGDLDTSFGTGGYALGGLAVQTGTNTPASAIDADGKILLCSSVQLGSSPNFSVGISVTRFAGDGTLDTSFGSEGSVDLDYGPGEFVFCSGVLLRSNGGIILAGAAYASNAAVVTALSADGSIDESFGGGSGRATLPALSGSDNTGPTIALQADGKLLVAGKASGSRYEYALARLDASGAPDTGFGGGGIVIFDFSGFAEGKGGATATAIAVTSTQNILVSGYIEDQLSCGRFAVLRYSPAGALDQGFAFNGRAVVQFDDSNGTPTCSFANAMTVQGDGKIVVAGSSKLADFSMGMAFLRLTADGDLDLGFGDNGKLVTSIEVIPESMPTLYEIDSSGALTQQSDGKLIAVGSSQVVIAGNPSMVSFYVSSLRLNGDGSPDTTFGASGRAFHAFGDTTLYQTGAAVALQRGAIILAGIFGDNDPHAFVARLMASPLDEIFADGFD